ncbi:hypothetical protein EG834_15245 [bacterium]|nr:hypothetical protein [bacterium]
MNYNMDMPILFFARRLLLWRGVDVFNLNPNTRSTAFQSASETDQLIWLQADMQAGIPTGLAQSNYRQLILVGKSIGSLAIATVVEYAQALLPTAFVWLTPLLRNEVVFQAAMNAAGPQVHLCGGADSTYKADRLQRILSTKPNASAYIADGANHILEVPGNDQATFTGFSGAMLFLGKFLDSVLAPTSAGTP